MVGIDGIDGSGKSSLAQHLARELGWTHINLDDYVEKDMGKYVEHVRYEQVQSMLNDTEGSIIIEGVCLLAVLEKLQRVPELLIYIKIMSHYGIWYDEDDCAVNGDINDFIRDKRESLQEFDVAFPELAEEIMRYHCHYRPQDKAHIVYERIDH